MTQYEPWYLQRKCPIFCNICHPVYFGVWSARKSVLIIGAILFAIGIMILLGLLLTCIAVECSAIASALVPLAIILIIVGILLFHCGWAAHLLDDDQGTDIPISTKTTYQHDEKLPAENELKFFESTCREPLPQITQGYWQFEDKEAWQTLANPYPIQHTLKESLARRPY